jgi:2-polyprenyl-3-methyl-5-hydroxy-6-metoxy-1,4-benzoquinol methylase
VVSDFDPREPWDLLVLDRRGTDVPELARFAHLPVIGLDEGGPARRLLPFLIDTPVGWSGGHAPNLWTASLLDLPARRDGWAFPFARILVSFGGEDAEDLSGRLLAVLLGLRIFAPAQLTVVQGPLFRRTSWSPGVTVLRNPPDLKNRLRDYDLVFTMFGLTACEARAAGVPAILFNPSRYHRRLGGASGFPDIGVRRPRRRRLRALLADRARFEKLLGATPEQAAGATPAALLAALVPGGQARCPACGATGNSAAARFSRRTYFRCRRCRILYLASFGQAAPSYGESYFFEEYRKQYGRTYLEDFANIQAAGRSRLRVLRALLPPGGPRVPRLLDIGCAYGPFLQACREERLEAEGWDLSAEAVRYVRERLGIPCRVVDFERDEAAADPGGGYSALTLWYVLEHFADPARVLRRANRLLADGGVLAFATPNAAGISARRSLRAFLDASPADHRTVWSPAAARKLLGRFGFSLRRVRITGHHPERFPGVLPPRLLAAASRALGLGDTFEAYAVKTGEPA